MLRFTVHGKTLAGEKLANCELLANSFLTNIHRYTKNVFSIHTDFSSFTKFFLANGFFLYGLPTAKCVWYVLFLKLWLYYIVLYDYSELETDAFLFDREISVVFI